MTIARLTGVLAKTFCLAAVDAAFYQVARGLLLPFTFVLSLLILRPRPTFPMLSVFGAATVLLGFGVGMSKDFGQHLTGVKGIVLGVGSSFTTAVESVVVKRYLNTPLKSEHLTVPEKDSDEEELGVWQLVWMSNVLALSIYVPLFFLSGGVSSISGSLLSGTPNPTGASFVPLAFLTGGVGFLLTLAQFMQISVTSPTTHMIVTAVRGVAQSSLAVIILHESITVGRASSMVLIVGGSAVYGWGKEKQLSAQRQDGYVRVDADDDSKWDEEEIRRAGNDTLLMQQRSRSSSSVPEMNVST